MRQGTVLLPPNLPWGLFSICVSTEYGYPNEQDREQAYSYGQSYLIFPPNVREPQGRHAQCQQEANQGRSNQCRIGSTKAPLRIWITAGDLPARGGE